MDYILKYFKIYLNKKVYSCGKWCIIYDRLDALYFHSEWSFQNSVDEYVLSSVYRKTLSNMK